MILFVDTTGEGLIELALLDERGATKKRLRKKIKRPLSEVFLSTLDQFLKLRGRRPKLKGAPAPVTNKLIHGILVVRGPGRFTPPLAYQAHTMKTNERRSRPTALDFDYQNSFSRPRAGFTTLRVTLATLNTLAWQLGIPIVGIVRGASISNALKRIPKTFWPVLPFYGQEPSITLKK